MYVIDVLGKLERNTPSPRKVIILEISIYNLPENRYFFLEIVRNFDS